MTTRGRKPKPRGAPAVLDQNAIARAIETAVRAATLYATSDKQTFIPADRSWAILEDYLLKLVQASNDYNAQTSPNFDRALVAAHAGNYVAEVERFFRWMPGAPARRANVAWKVVVAMLFHWKSGLLRTVAGAGQKRASLHWRTFSKLALDPKRGSAEAAWECVASVIGISGKILRREAGAPGVPVGAFKKPSAHLIRRLGALIK